MAKWSCHIFLLVRPFGLGHGSLEVFSPELLDDGVNLAGSELSDQV